LANWEWDKDFIQLKMTPEEQAIVKDRLREVAEILYKNTVPEELKTFETIELSVREHLLETVAPEIGNFFSAQQGETKQEEKET
jgi:Trp operon repressor